VVVADSRPDNASIDSQADDLDLYTEAELEEILSALRTVCRNLTVYSCPADFIDSIQHHSGALVVPLWAGRVSRNRTALVSAISEAYGMDFFGADAYAYIVGQDKSLAKKIAKDFQIDSPASVLIHSIDRLHLIKLLTTPLVVKPNFQGSSIGISTRNLCSTVSEASTIATELLDRFKQPVLVETFIGGIEATVTIFGSDTHIHLFQAMEVVEPTGQIDFKTTIWSYELKKANNRLPIVQRALKLSTSDQERLQQLFRAFGKLELVRIDGRIRDGVFNFLEMNPEPYLSQFGSVHKAFAFHGFSYEEMFWQLLLPFEVNSQRETPVN
jgi:D-alanine-D-alanine ligase